MVELLVDKVNDWLNFKTASQTYGGAEHIAEACRKALENLK